MLATVKETRISKCFNSIDKGENAFIPYITAGDPNLEKTKEIVLALEKAGADIVELGIPFSDPLADGPIIQKAAGRSLENGTNLEKIFKTVEEIRKETDIPLVFLIYINTVLQFGLESLLERCRETGVDGLIIPDLPVEERRELLDLMEEYPVDLIPLASLTSKGRVSEVVSCGSGFVYCISSNGVTGKRNSFDNNLGEMMKNVRKATDLPLAIGFGISSEDQIRELKNLCDGVIVGSALVEQIEKRIEDNSILERVYDMAFKMKEAARGL